MAEHVERPDENARQAPVTRLDADQIADATPAAWAKPARRHVPVAARLRNVARRARIAAYLAADAAPDLLLRIRARGPWRRPPAAARNNPYEPLPHVVIRSILRRLSLSEEDIVCDLGCGKGRMLCCLARHPVKLCLGVEIDEDLAAMARANLARQRRLRSPVEIRVGDAVETDLSGVTVLFLYNPFGAEVLREVLTNLRACAASRPARLLIIYAAPAHLSVFGEFPEFRIFDRLTSPYFDGHIETVFLSEAPADTARCQTEL
jgi:protein-L-isoaspartate O-methyltransferase